MTQNESQQFQKNNVKVQDEFSVKTNIKNLTFKSA